MTDNAPPPQSNASASVPYPLKAAAAWSWRVLLVGVALAVILWLIVQLRIIIIPVLVAVLFTALLAPMVAKLRTWGIPKWLGVITALLTLFAAITILGTLIVTQLRNFSGSFLARSETAYRDIIDWLASGPLSISEEEIDQFFVNIIETIEQNSSSLWSGALSVGVTLGHILAGTLLVLFSLVFLLIDGPRIWRWVVGLSPSAMRPAVDGAGRAGWVSVGHYVRIQIFVAFVDAVGIGIGAAILQVPLVIPIAILVFLGSFVPFLGTIAAGAVATFIALVYNGPVNALFMLGVVILVNQIEGHILQPLVMGNAVRVHPLAVVLAVTTGTLVAGIPGALFAVPIVASLNSIARYLKSGVWRNKPDPLSLPEKKWMQEAVAEAKAELGTQTGLIGKAKQKKPKSPKGGREAT